MSYIEDNLMANEKIKYKTMLHGFVLIKPLVLLIISLFIFCPFITDDTFFGCLVLVVLFLEIQQIIKYTTTNIVVTNKRLIVKTGLLKTDLITMFLDKIETVQIKKDAITRFLNCGNIVITGLGGKKRKFKNVAKPNELKNQLGL